MNTKAIWFVRARQVPAQAEDDVARCTVLTHISRIPLPLPSHTVPTPSLAQPDGFDPTKSQVADDKLAEFLDAALEEDITSVPGVGPAAAEKLAAGDGDDQVTTTYQLIAKFLYFRGAGVSCAEQCDAMWYWLQAKGVSSHRAGIVHAIAEKVNTMIPGMYDAADFQ